MYTCMYVCKYARHTTKSTPWLHQWGGMSAEALCPVGYYCFGGIRVECPSGTFGRTRGMTVSVCVDVCLFVCLFV